MTDRTARIAIVDDEESIRRALLRLFRTTGLEAEVFASAGDFLESLRDSQPDCLILDLHMPGMTGMMLLRKLAHRIDAPPVIVMTAFDDRHVYEECMSLGARHYLRKPIDSKC